MSESKGWFRAMRTQEVTELLAASPDAFLLAFVIAFRAQWSTRFNRHGCAPGEAFLGDFQSYGMTERRYRTAKAHLEKWGFATFRATNKGTVARLTDTRLFEVLLVTGDEQNDRQETNSRRTTRGRATTTDEQKIYRTIEVVGEPAPPTRLPRPKKPVLALDDEAWIAGLEATPAYRGIDVRTLLGKMRLWCEVNQKVPTRRRFANWLNRERPMRGVSGIQPEQPPDPQPTKITFL
jgi:hypothetical protein